MLLPNNINIENTDNTEEYLSIKKKYKGEISDTLNMQSEIFDILKSLSEYDDFSFDYKVSEPINGKFNSKLDQKLNDVYNNFKLRFPGYVKNIQDMVSFLGYQRDKQLNFLDNSDISMIEDFIKKFMSYNIIDGIQSSNKSNSVNYRRIDKDKIFKFGLYNDFKKLYNKLRGKYKWLVIDINDMYGLFDHILNKELEKYIKAEEIDGIFCDIDDTLILGGHLNKFVVSFLLKKYGEGKKVFLWTSGDIEKKSKMLSDLYSSNEFEKFGLTKTILESMGLIKYDKTGNKIIWNIMNKNRYPKVNVECAIDDRLYKRFVYQLGIIPKNFINVTDLK